MITVTAKRSVLVKREMKEGKMVDVMTTKRGTPIGVEYIKNGDKTVKKVKYHDGKIQLSEEDAIRIWGALDLTEEQAKKLNKYAREQKIKRVI